MTREFEEMYADEERTQTERWVGETLRNVSLIAAGFAAQSEGSHALHVANTAWVTYLKLEQYVREAAP